MSKMLEDLVVVAKYNNDHIEECLRSLGNTYQVKVIDTSGGGYSSGAYIRAFYDYPAKNYFFMQDSMTALQPDYLEPFKQKMPALGCVAWGTFGFGYDDSRQRAWVESQYSGSQPEYGIFGPVFFTNYQSLNLLAKKGLLPLIPDNKLEAQGTERAWAWAFKQAGLPIETIRYWDKGSMQHGTYPIFRKVFAGRT